MKDRVSGYLSIKCLGLDLILNFTGVREPDTRRCGFKSVNVVFKQAPTEGKGDTLNMFRFRKDGCVWWDGPALSSHSFSTGGVLQITGYFYLVKTRVPPLCEICDADEKLLGVSGITQDCCWVAHRCSMTIRLFFNCSLLGTFVKND